MGEQLQLWTTSGLEPIGTVGNSIHSGGGLPTLGNLDQLDEIVERYNVGELVLATSALSREQMLDIFQKYGMG